MQLHKTMRRAGVSLSAAALALLTAEGTAAAQERTSSPDLQGRVTSVASGDFVLQKHDGTTETVDTTDATTYSEPGTAVAPEGLQDGEHVAVELDSTASSPTATNVIVFPERISGRVSNVAGSTVTLANKRGTDTVLVSSSTKYYEKGVTATSVSNGELVSVFGLPDPGTPGELDAQVVAIFSPAPPPAPRPAATTPSVPQPHPQPVRAPVSPGPHVGDPQGQPVAPPSGRAPGAPGWGQPTPNGASFGHGPSGGPGGPGSGGSHGGGFGGHR